MFKSRNKILFGLCLIAIILSTSSCGSTDNNPSPTPYSANCTKDQIQVNISWSTGIEFRLNHCLVRDVTSGGGVVTFIAGLVAQDCPNIACKGIATAIAAFMITQTAVLQDLDAQCDGQGAIAIVGSFKDKALWETEPICNTPLGHLIVVNNVKNDLHCDGIYLTFTLHNTGKHSMLWHLAIYYGNTNVSPPNLVAFLGTGEHIRTGRKAGAYDKEGLIPNQEVVVTVAGNVDHHQVQKYKQITLSFLGDQGDSKNPQPLSITCS